MYPSKISIRVTLADFDNGIADDSKRCPIALAVRRMFPRHKVSVSVESIELNKHGNDDYSEQRVFYKLDESGTTFVIGYDHGTAIRRPRVFAAVKE